MPEEIDYGSLTPFELVRLYFPDASDELCELLIWERTSYPFVEAEEIARQLREFAEKSRKAK